MTFTSCSASSLAAISPDGPPPTMMTSLSVKSMNSSLNSSVIARVTSASPAALKPLNCDIPLSGIFWWYKLLVICRFLGVVTQTQPQATLLSAQLLVSVPMNMLVDGEWRTDTFQATNEEGAFERQTTPFRNWIAGSDVPDHVDAEPDDRFEAEAGRYHLYVSLACPWAHRTLLVRALMGLEDAIGVSVVDPWRGEDGWQFSPDKPGCTVDHLHGSDTLRERYVAADPEATCRVTVPVLWDTVEDTIVNNESREILRMLTTAFDDLGNDVS